MKTVYHSNKKKRIHELMMMFSVPKISNHTHNIQIHTHTHTLFAEYSNGENGKSEIKMEA